ncbi:D-2-hydroxyacid dehydrogenase [soil metagenome]
MEHALHLYHQSADLLAKEVRARAPQRQVIALKTIDELTGALPDVSVLLTAIPPREGWARARRLALIQLLGVGAEMLLPSFDLPPSVEVATLRGVFAAEVAEHVIAMTLALIRALPTLTNRQRAHDWTQFASGTLAKKTIGIVGLGAIGRRIARVAHAFDARVLATRRVASSPVPFVEREYAAGDLDEMLRESDVVVVCLPKTPTTTRLFDRTRLLGLKQGALLVNVARGGIVDEAALLEVLGNGHLGGAAIDVFAEEPLAAASALWNAPNTIVTPHIAGWGLDYLGRGVDVFLENVSRLEANAPRVGLVDREAGY